MRFLVFLFIGVASAASAGGNTQHKTDPQVLHMQKKVFDLLYHYTQQNGIDEQVKYGREFSFKKYKEFFLKPQVVEKWQEFIKRGLTPKYNLITLSSNEYLLEAVALFKVFYYAKDWNTFYRVACWAREHVNEGIFAYSFMVAILHRKDTKSLVLPASYETYPYYFISPDVLAKCNRIKLQGYITDEKLARHYGVYVGENNVYTVSNIYFNSSFEYNDQEQKLTYFRNDVDLNAFYFYFHANYPFWLGGNDFNLYNDRRGEQFYFIHQQLLARYKMERYANGLGEIPKFDWRKPLEYGFDPKLSYHNGLAMPARCKKYNFYTENVVEVENYERRIWDAIYKGYETLTDGTKIPLMNSEDIEYLGRFVDGNSDFGSQKFSNHLIVLAKHLLGGSRDSKPYIPSALEQYHTTTRDPAFYQIFDRVMSHFVHFKNNLPSYTSHDLAFDGVTVEKVKFSPLVTYFEDHDFDITNAIYQSKDEITNSKEKFVFKARQAHLNHKSFSINIDISSKKDVDATVRVYLGPKYDNFGRPLDINKNRHNFVELDYFVHSLKNGKNSVLRRCSDFAHVMLERKSTRELHNYLKNSLENDSEFSFNLHQYHNGWPSRLLLPKGHKEGLDYQVYVVVTPFRPSKAPYTEGFQYQYTAAVDSQFQRSSFDWNTGFRYESMPFGFPFDRVIDLSAFQGSNIYNLDVKIYHSDSPSIEHITEQAKKSTESDHFA